jgi:antitoxin component of MazEF toxin-antitoxin module
MTTTNTSFGESFGVRFPKTLLKNMPVSENEDVEIRVKDNSIIINLREGKRHLTTKERVAAFYETVEDVQVFEIDWGTPQGKEIW